MPGYRRVLICLQVVLCDRVILKLLCGTLPQVNDGIGRDGIGRDHLDCGSVTSPNREIAAMKDGSDAIADWPLLNAMLNTACGASWVSLHQGGGVGIGYSIHAGIVCLADGTEQADRRSRRVLTADLGTGGMRHVDAGYEEAKETAKSKGVNIPMKA